MAFSLPDLPYSHDALAAHGMSAETMEYNHDLHHNAYVVNGNKLIAGTDWEDKSLEDIIVGTYQAGAVAQNGIFNNASQHWPAPQTHHGRAEEQRTWTVPSQKSRMHVAPDSGPRRPR